MPWDEDASSPWSGGNASPPWNDNASSSSEVDASSRPGPSTGGWVDPSSAAGVDASAWARPGPDPIPWHKQSHPQADPAHHPLSMGSDPSHSPASAWTSDGPDSRWSTPGPASPAPAGRTSPPIHYLLVGVAAVVVAAGLGFVGGWQVDLIGWAVASLVGLGSVFLFMSSDVRAQMNPWYLGKPSLVRPLQAAVIVGAVAVAAAHAWSFADWASRQDFFW